jgi:hypothetical protein
MTQNKHSSNSISPFLKTLFVPACLIFLVFSPLAHSHDIDVTGVARVFLDETPQGIYRLSIADQQVPPLFNIERILPARCKELPPSRYSYRFSCQPILNIDDSLTFPWDFQGVVVVAKWQDENGISGYFPSKGGQIEVSLAELKADAASISSLASRYLLLGAEHISFGIDHLLFIAGLLLLLQNLKLLIATVTAFTGAHSITLAASVFGVFPVPGPPIEALIALSIAFLAREIIMGYRGKKSLTHAKPWLVAFGFGLIHGFGFAGALGELGLASKDIPLALLFFNLGVEAGQVVFIAVLATALWLINRFAQSWTKPLELTSAYALGGVSVYWFSERLPILFFS